MNGPLMRSAIGCAIACGAVVAGPSIAGIGVAKADLLGVGGGNVNVLGVDVLGGGQGARSGSAAGRVSSLPAVSTAPSTRNVVIRAKPEAAQVDPKFSAASFDTVAAAPAVALGAPIAGPLPAAMGSQIPEAGPFSVSPPAAPAVRVPAPDAVPVPSTVEPGPGREVAAPADRFSPAAKIPDSFRVGYAEYLRAATTTDLFVAALPGVTGIAGFTLVGAYAGYRQARAVQVALLAPAPTSVLL